MNYRRVIKLYTVLAAMAILLAGCAAAAGPNTVPRSPAATAAIKGRAVVSAARAVLPVIDSHITLGLLPKPAGIRILQTLKLVGQQAGTMAQALAVMDATSVDTPEHQGAALAAHMALAAIQKALLMAKQPADPALAAEVMKLLAGLSLAVNEVTLVLQEGRS